MKPGYKNEINLKGWVLPNNLKFPSFIKQNFQNKYNTKFSNGICELFQHQRLIKDFLQYNSPYRGLLVYHGLGVGKTRSAIITAETLSSDLEIVVMLPASIEQNFINEIFKCANNDFLYDGFWVKKENAWVRRDMKQNNYETLNVDDKNKITKQIQESIKKKFTFIHYNGLTAKNVDAYSEGFFDNKIIIIDEVHNFISRVLNNSRIARSIYKLIMKAKNTKLLLLSGTPIINKPYEMSLLLNLVKGFIHTVIVRCAINEKLSSIEETILKSEVGKYVDYMKLNLRTGMIKIIPVQDGFIKNKDGLIERIDTAQEKNIKNVDKHLINFISGNSTVKSFITKNYTLFPTDEDEFDDYFIDFFEEKNHIKNKNLLSRRLTGLVSHFEFYDPEKYPTLKDIEYVKCKMSDHHFTKYMSLRQIEFDMEQKSKKFNKDKKDNDDLKKNSVYRSFSRAVCNFSFPEEIKRIYPSSIGEMQKETDISDVDGIHESKFKDLDEEIDENVSKKKDTKGYKKQIETVLDSLYEKKEEYLKGDGLKKYGPKYKRAITKILKSEGPVLVYSQFRNVEGLKIMELVLRTENFIELNIKKNKATNSWSFTIEKEDFKKKKYIIFTDDKQKNKILMDIYNSDFDIVPSELHEDMNNMISENKSDMNLHGKLVQVLMITQSGAEGISLKNVRQVHIMEPYWNNIRAKQVIGRAVRAESHSKLPKAERVVEVFVYITKFNTEQLKDSVVISREQKLTTDEYVLNIAKKKAKIIDSLQDMMKKSAVDCVFHKKTEDDIKCYKVQPNFAEISQNEYFYIDDISGDIKDSQIKIKIKDVKKEVQREVMYLKSEKIKQGIPYFKDTNEVLDPNKFKKGVYEVIGIIVEDENGVKSVKRKIM